MAVEELSPNDDDLGFPRKINFPICVRFEKHRASTCFSKVDPNGAYEVTANQRNLRGFLEFDLDGAYFGDKNT